MTGDFTQEAKYLLESLGQGDSLQSNLRRNTLAIDSARAFLAEQLTDQEIEEVGDTVEFAIPGPDHDPLTLRVYSPHREGPHPVMVFLHGGGWHLGDLETGDSICRAITNEAGCLVVAMDYRLAPEFPFPAALEDCYTAVEWVVNHVEDMGGDPDRVGVGGSSAGGNLATAVSLLARDRGGPRIGYQLLLAPVLLAPGIDYEYTTDLPPRETEGKNFTDEAIAEWHASHYFETDIDRRNPYGSPLLATSLRGLPPTKIISAGFDRLRPQCAEYNYRLQQAGISVEHVDYEEMVHGFYYFVNDPNVETPRLAIREAAEHFRDIIDAL